MASLKRRQRRSTSEGQLRNLTPVHMGPGGRSAGRDVTEEVGKIWTRKLADFQCIGTVCCSFYSRPVDFSIKFRGDSPLLH